MAMTQQKQPDSGLWINTDPAAELSLATIESYSRVATTPWVTSFSGLVEFFSQRPKYSPTKEGKGFIVGPCTGTRRDANMSHADVAVIDADSHITNDGRLETGAPDPLLVHEALKRFYQSHIIYTTYSHGSGKGNRYRIIFPVKSYSKLELLTYLSFITEHLQTQGLPIALTRESSVWTQPWQLPKVSGDQAPYLCLSYLGYSCNTRNLACHMGKVTEDGKPISATIPHPIKYDDDQEGSSLSKPPSVINQFNSNFSAIQWLEQFGYEYSGQQVLVDEEGNPQLTYRFKKPNSGSTAGVIAFADPYNMVDGEPNFCIYSHHGTDPLSNGHANDSFEVFRLLHGLDKRQAILHAASMLSKSKAHELNMTYPSVADGGPFKILNRCEYDGRVYYTAGDWNTFKMSTIHLPPVPTIEKLKETGEEVVAFKKVPDFWLHCGDRKVYKDTVFKPWPAGSEGTVDLIGTNGLYFNKFPGWACAPSKGRWALLEEHLRYTICGNSEREYNYLLDWFAHLFQRPDEKPGVAVVLRGAKGRGKSVAFQLIASAIGRSALVLANNKQLTGQFSGHLSTCLLAVVEESFFAGAHQQEGVLKHLITDTETTFEAKGRDAKAGNSYLRVVLITNEDWAAPASDDERRYFIPTVGDYSYRKDLRLNEESGEVEKGYFFPQLVTEMKNGGVEAFVYDMLRRELSPRSLVNVPETAGLQEQRAYTLSGPRAWAFKALREGRVEVADRIYTWSSQGLKIPEYELMAALSAEASQFERQRNFGFKALRSLQNSFGDSIKVGNGVVFFNSLRKCREEFVTRTKLPPKVFDTGTLSIEAVTPDSGMSMYNADTPPAFDIGGS